MRIVIETTGFWDTTKVTFNGKEQVNLKEFNFSVKVGSKPKIQMVQEIEKQNHFLSYFGQDFTKFDEYVKEN